MSAIGEVWSFGIGYMAFFFLVVMFWLRTTSRLIIAKIDIPALLIAVPSYYFIIKLFSYALRASWRLMILVTLIALYVEYRRKRKLRKARRTPSREQLHLVPKFNHIDAD